MRSTIPESLNRFTLAITILSVCMLSGCRGGKTVPTLSDLAWWKKDNASIARTDAPPPPARHFAPEPSGIADAGSEELRDNLNQILAQAKEEKEDARRELERQPYSQQGAAPEFYELSEPVAFDPLTGKLKTQLPDFESGMQDLKDVQQTAANGIEGVSPGKLKQVIANESGSFEGALAAAQDEIRNSTRTTSEQKWKEDIALPKPELGGSFGNTIAAARETLNRGTEEVVSGGGSFISGVQEKTQAVADNVSQMGGQLVTNTTNAVSETVDTVARGGGSFGNVVADAVDSTVSTADAIVANNPIPGSPIPNSAFTQGSQSDPEPSTPATTSAGGYDAIAGTTDVISNPRSTAPDRVLETRVDQLQQTIQQLQTQIAQQKFAEQTSPQAGSYVAPLNPAPQRHVASSPQQMPTAPTGAVAPASSVQTVGDGIDYAPGASSHAHERLATLQPNTRLTPGYGRYQNTGAPEYGNSSPGAESSLVPPSRPSSSGMPSNTLRGSFSGSYPGSSGSGVTNAGFNETPGTQSHVQTVSGIASGSESAIPTAPVFDSSPYAPGSVRHSIPEQ